MSWMKRPKEAAAATSGLGQQSYPPPQPFGNQQNAYPNYQASTNTPQQLWPMPPQQQPQYNQAQYSQGYQQSEYGNNANQVYQPPNQYNQNFTNQSYNNTQQIYQQTYYQNQGVQQQNYTQNKTNVESWEDNWDWGWEDSSKQVQNTGSHNQALLQPPVQTHSLCNANVIEESFASTEAWNWSTDDSKGLKDRNVMVTSKQDTKDLTTQPISNSSLENNVINESNTPRSISNYSALVAEEIRTLEDRDTVKENLPNLAVGKRFHSDNLTPQWSIESQMSQESSDGPHTHSESTYRSDNQSQNSNKSSPILSNDNSNFIYSQSGLEEPSTQNSEWLKQSTEEPIPKENLSKKSEKNDAHESLANKLQDMSITNSEISVSDSLQLNKELENKDVLEKENNIQSQPSHLPANFLPPPFMDLPKPISTNMPPQLSTALPIPPPTSGPLHPPTDFPAALPQNPFKHAGPITHRSTAKGTSTMPPSSQPFSPAASAPNLMSPAVVNKISQYNRVPVGFGANLETTPDNSERPDQPQISAFRPVSSVQQIPDNLEVAPKNDRNEYLQTAHLSSSGYGDNNDFSRSVPPPGLRRMVVGQQESEYVQNLNLSVDEPPPGLARMVPGQQTETEHAYNQNSDNYMDRHIDGQTTDGSGRPYRQADGQQTSDNYSQPPNRGNERRPIGLDRMVPGEPSNLEYQYQGAYSSTNEERVVTGVDHDYDIPNDTALSDIREQNVDGSDYTEQSPRNPTRSMIGAREVPAEATSDYNPALEDQREIIMEGENLQDLSVISSTELTFSREQILEGADVNVTDVGTDRKTDVSDSMEHPTPGSRRQSLNHTNTSGDDSERDRLYKSSPRRDRDKRRSPRDRDRDKDSRYIRDDRKYHKDSERRPRDDRRFEKERKDKDRDRRDRHESPDDRKYRRSTRGHRYETEDTDYYSDRERDRVHHREGSYTSSKPPRPEDKDKRYRNSQERGRRYNTIEREKRSERYEDERERSTRSRRGDCYQDRYERKYRDIDPTRKYGNRRRERDEEERRREREGFSGGSREGLHTDEELNDTMDSRRRSDRRRRTTHNRDPRDPRDPYYNGYGVSAMGGAATAGAALRDPYVYQYYEQLRVTNPAAYLEVYNKLMAGLPPPPPPADYLAALRHQHPHYAALYEGYGAAGYDARGEGRGSVHSGRSSANGLKGTDTELNTDMSLNLHLEESTVRSERMTPFKFSTAHVKGSVSARHVVVVRGSYPVDGAPATVRVLSMASALAHLPTAADLRAYPGPLQRGVTHKKSVIEYCELRRREAALAAPHDPVGYGLVWDFLALLLRQNGVVVGSDIAELLMRNSRDYQYREPEPARHTESRGEESPSAAAQEEQRTSTPDRLQLAAPDLTTEEKLDQLREHLTFGKRQEALEWSMSCGLWAHAWSLGAHADRRTRALVAARFLAALPQTDPLHTLYAALAVKQPPAATCVRDERWGDWRPHAAIVLSNASGKPDQDQRTLTQLGDSLLSRGLLYSAQFCYLCAGVGISRHPLAPLSVPPTAGAPPRLALLLADSRADRLAHFATDRAICATEVYEYALSLAMPDYVINELQVYKFVLAVRLCDVGEYERALAYVEAASRAVLRAPRDYAPALLRQLANLADRLKYVDPALHEEPVSGEEGGGDSADTSPRHHQWLRDVTSVADALAAESAGGSYSVAQHSPQHAMDPSAVSPQHAAHQQYGWPQQNQESPYNSPAQPIYESAAAEGEVAYGQQYYPPPPQPQLADLEPAPASQPATYDPYGDWNRTSDSHQTSYGDPYWQTPSYADGEGGAGAGAGGGEARPTITMPGAAPASPHSYGEYEDERPPSADVTDRETETPKSAGAKQEEGKGKSEAKGKGGGWLGGLFRFNLRAPNQMILPDDKNPAIVWDAERKRWRNRDGDDDDAPHNPAPPPKMADLVHHAMAAAPASAQSSAHPAPTPATAPAAPASPAANVYKLPKSRHIKKSYVDVFNPSGAATRPLPPAAEVLGPAGPAPGPAGPLTYFVPAPTHTQGGMYDPTAAEDDAYRSGI